MGILAVDWKDGKGVAGSWDCTMIEIAVIWREGRREDGE